jgi:hypothetical protein
MSTIQTNVVKPKLSFFENEVENLILDGDKEVKLDNELSDIENYIKNNNGRGKSEDEKDLLYKEAQELWKKYSRTLRDTKYNFFLNRIQWKFLTDLILTKLEYDVNTVFLAIEVAAYFQSFCSADLLGNMKGIKFRDDNELVNFPVNATEITYIYHLISKHKVKGLTKDSYTFSKVLIKIGDISKVFNYYETSGKNLSNDIQDWVTLFDEGITADNLENTQEVIKAEVI